MRYKPNYCCNCGEKIERPTASFTDSKMFCDVCKHDFVLPRVVPVAFAALMALIGIFGLGSYLRSGDKPLSLAPRRLAANTGRTEPNVSPPGNSNAPAPAKNVSSNAPPAANRKSPAPDLQNEPARQPALETVSFCGAETKKGTPCSRRVRGGGRCWQHRGQTALLPAEKLLIDQ